VYDENAVRQVANIRYLLDAGLTVEDVRHFRFCLDGDLPNSRPSKSMLEVGRRRLAVLNNRIADLVRVRDHLSGQLAAASKETNAEWSPDRAAPAPGAFSGAVSPSRPSGDWQEVGRTVQKTPCPGC
jgi:DNA-binding transcriptional MerR regulator